MGFLKPPKVDIAAPPTPPPAPPPFVSTPAPKRKPMTPSFLGTEMTPGAGAGAGGMERGKTLLGQ